MGTIVATAVPLFLSIPAFSQSEEMPIPLDVERDTEQSTRFWPAAQALTQSQLHLLSRVEEAFATPDPNQVRAARGQIILNLGQLDRFLDEQNLASQSCGIVLSGGSQSSAANRLNCHLYAALNDWEGMLPLLDSRLAMLATIAEVKPLPLVSGESVMGWGGIPAQVKGSLREPAPPLNAPLPAVEAVPLPLGRSIKSALGDYRPQLSPAIAPLGAGVGQVQRLASRLSQMQVLFPTAFADFVDRQTRVAVRDLPPEQDPDLQDYAELLAEPYTGIASIRPAPAPPTLVNRLTPAPDPFTPLLAPTEQGFQPSLKLQVTNPTAGDPTLEIVTSELDYGFLIPIGDVPLAAVSADLEDLGLPSPVRDFILSYQPPQNLEALQVDRRRFLTGKQAAFLSLREPLRLTAPLQLQQTYLLRSLQFQVPPLLQTRRLTVSGDRRYLAEATQVNSSDLLLVIRPIARRSDGSYRMVWRILKEFPNPEFENLWEYIDQ